MRYHLNTYTSLVCRPDPGTSRDQQVLNFTAKNYSACLVWVMEIDCQDRTSLTVPCRKVSWLVLGNRTHTEHTRMSLRHSSAVSLITVDVWISNFRDIETFILNIYILLLFILMTGSLPWWATGLFYLFLLFAILNQMQGGPCAAERFWKREPGVIHWSYNMKSNPNTW